MLMLKPTITVAALAADGGNNGIAVVFKNQAPFTNGIIETNNRQIKTSMQ